MSSALDHCPISLRLEERKKFKRYGKNFSFEAIWLKESNCEEVVNSTWEEGAITGSDHPIMQCLDDFYVKLEV
uniref:Uncharacterized protein n=1 Tax=Quercus lobata TaxID=97700 RepID=A0A7N2R3B3_QUELO